MVDNMRPHEEDAEYAQHAPAEDFELQNNLKVFYHESGEQRSVVAAPSTAAAAKLLGMTRYVFTRAGGETNLSEDIEVAMCDPGAIFQRDGGHGEWMKVKSSAAATKLPKHGGARAGSGAKPISDDKMHLRTFLCTDEQWEMLTDLGKGAGAAAFIRSIADKAIHEFKQREANAAATVEEKTPSSTAGKKPRAKA